VTDDDKPTSQSRPRETTEGAMLRLAAEAKPAGGPKGKQSTFLGSAESDCSRAKASASRAGDSDQPGPPTRQFVVSDSPLRTRSLSPAGR
jgi:hypothetical protein